MSFPTGVTTRNVSFGKGFITSGDMIAASLTVTPVFGAGTDFLVWSATGDPWLPFSYNIAVEPNAVGFMPLPVTDQDGWVDPMGQAFKSWTYTGVLTYTRGSSTTTITRTFQLPAGAAAIDFDTLIASDGAGQPVVVPNKYVRSVNNTQADQSGNVSLPDLTDLSARVPSGAVDVGATTDLNTLQRSGWYLGGSGNPNSPYGGRWLMDVRAANPGGGYTIQRFTVIVGDGAGLSWERYTNAGTASGSWTPWAMTKDTGGSVDGVLRNILGATERIAPLSQSKSTVDMNTLLSNGFFYGSDMPNAPDTGFWYVFVQASTATTYVKQTVSKAGLGPGGAGVTWTRYKEGDNTSWSAWDQIADSSGALDAVIRADVANRFGKAVTELSNADLNNFTQTGFYRGNTLTNAPTGNTQGWWYVEVIAHDSNGWLKQIATGYAGTADRSVWIRQKRNGAWDPWVQVADAQGAYDVVSRGAVKKAAYRMGGTHNSTNLGGSGQTAIRERTPGLQLPVQATRWRIHFRNYNSLTSSNSGSNPVTVQRVMVGPSAGPTATSEYTCSAPLQQVPGAAGAVQGTTEWVSDWHTPASVGIVDTRQRFNVQLDLTCTANDYIGMNSSMFCAMIDTTAIGTGVVAPTVADPGPIGGSGSATSWYSYSYMVGEAWIEYEYQDAKVPSLLFVGHSYVDAAQFSATAGQLGQPSGFAQKFSRRHKAAVTVNALSTSKMTDWANGATISNKFDILTVAQGYNFDAVFLMIGGNDIVNESPTPSAATLLSRFQAVVNAITTRYPGVPIFAATNTPVGAVGDTTWGSGGTAVTQAMLDSMDGFNAGLFSTIRGLAGVVDFESVIKDPANTRRPQAALLGGDRIHPNPRGYDALADAITLA